MELLNLFLDHKKGSGLNRTSLNYYKLTILKMLDNVNKNVTDISSDDLIRYLINYKQAKDCSDYTLDNLRRIFSTFFEWLEFEQYIMVNPVNKIKRLDNPYVCKTRIGFQQFDLLNCNLENNRDKAILELLYTTGIRVSELINLNISDVDFYNREIKIKGNYNRERIVKINGLCKTSLMKYLEDRDDDNPALFVAFKKPNRRLEVNGIERIFRDVSKKCKMSGITPKTFRMSKVFELYDKGVPLEQIQNDLGFARLQTVERYVKMV